MPDYWPPDISRDDKVEALKNDQHLRDLMRKGLRPTSTYFDQARIAEKLDQATRKSGHIYPGQDDMPTLPPTSPWSSGYAPGWKPEESLGVSVDDCPVSGEPHEIERAAQILAQQTPSSHHELGAEDGAEGELLSGFSPSPNLANDVSRSASFATEGGPSLSSPIPDDARGPIPPASAPPHHGVASSGITPTNNQIQIKRRRIV